MIRATVQNNEHSERLEGMKELILLLSGRILSETQFEINSFQTLNTIKNPFCSNQLCAFALLSAAEIFLINLFRLEFFGLENLLNKLEPLCGRYGGGFFTFGNEFAKGKACNWQITKKSYQHHVYSMFPFVITERYTPKCKYTLCAQEILQ